MQAGPISDRAWAAAQASLDSALAALDGMVAARVQARIMSDVLPALTAAVGKGQKSRDSGRPAAQPLQVTVTLPSMLLWRIHYVASRLLCL